MHPALSALLFVAQLGSVPALPPGAARIDVTEPGRIEGQAVDPVSNESLAGFSVGLFRRSLIQGRDFPEPWVPESPEEELLARVATSESGLFRFEGLSIGSYTVRALDGHVEARPAETRLSVEDPHRQVQLQVEIGTEVRGRVEDSSGQSLEGFVVMMTGHDTGNGLNASVLSRRRPRARSEADGSFVIRNLPRGRVYLQAALQSYGYSPLTVLELRGGPQQDDLVLVVEDERELLMLRSEDDGGVGVKLDFTTVGPAVSELIDGMPAQAAGLQENDLIVAIEGLPTRFMTPAEFIHRCRGPAGSTVRLTTQRDTEVEQEVVLTRADFPRRQP